MQYFVLNEKELEDHVGEIMCSICLCVQVNPYISTKCFHRFCKKCIIQWKNSGKNTCPECRVSPLILLEDIRTKRIINQLEVKCEHCKNIGKYNDGKWMNTHLTMKCKLSDTCAICHNNLVYICIGCEADHEFGESVECKVAFGECEHIFHKHCISRWLKSRNFCPLDDQKWTHTIKKYTFAPIKKYTFAPIKKIEYPDALFRITSIINKVIITSKKHNYNEILEKSKKRWKSVYTTKFPDLKLFVKGFTKMIIDCYLKLNNDGSYSYVF